MPTIILLRGSADANNPLIGLEGEVTFDSTKGELRLHDGDKAGGHEVAISSVTALSQLTDASNIWTDSSLTKVSQLGNDSEFWSTSSLTKVSQLQNDSAYKNGFCQYCSHCTYCQNCGRCNNVQCSQVQCNQKNCQNCSDCTACSKRDFAYIGGFFVSNINICHERCVYKDC
jgi:hypothetical protein